MHQELLEADAPAWQSGLRIVYVPVAADERLPKLVSGAIDLECGSTTANAERARTVAFSPVFFLAGTKLMVPVKGHVGSYRDLAGRTVAVSAGTTNAEALRRLADRVSPPIKVVETPGLDAAYDMLAAGKADAFARTTFSLRASSPRARTAGTFGSSATICRIEPYAIALRKDDPAFAALVRDAFARMAEEGTLSRLYARWLVSRLPTGETLGVPMSAQLAEMYRAMGQPD